MGHINAGNGVTAVLTDSRCNQHITARGSIERAVRLPAAIRGAKNAGAGSKSSMPLLTKIEETYIEQAEQKVIPMAHKASYVNRLKRKIAAFPIDAKGLPLTDDSDGEGGDDTSESLHFSFFHIFRIVRPNIQNQFCAFVLKRGLGVPILQLSPEWLLH